MIRIVLLVVLMSLPNACAGQKYSPFINVPYGKHARNVLDFHPTAFETTKQQDPTTEAATVSKHISRAANEEGLNVYEAVPGLEPSDKFRFRVRTTKGEWHEPFAFITTCKQGDGKKTNNYFDHLSGWTNTYINFEMSRPVEIAIGKANGQKIRKAVAHPKHKVASCKVRKGIAYVVMNEPGLVAIDIDGQMDDQDTGKGYKGPPIHTVTLFANPFLKNRPQKDDPTVHLVKPGEEPPHKGTWKTLCFLPGVHDIGVGYPLRANTNYYIPGDAIVYGTMNNLGQKEQGRNIRIFGHGTLSGARTTHPRYTSPQPKQHQMHTPIRIIGAGNTTVEGITLADSANHSLMLLHRYRPDEPTDIRWVKIFTWRGNGDGINPFDNGLIEDCFIRTQDDSSYVNGRGMRRVVFWNDWNGSAFVLSALPNRSIIVEDCDVIYARAGWHHWSGGRTFNMRALGSGPCGEGVIFRNIRISDPRPTLQHFMIAMKGVKPYVDPKKFPNRGAGDLSGVLFQNIEIAAPSVLGEPEFLWGMPDGEIRDIRLTTSRSAAGRLPASVSSSTTNTSKTSLSNKCGFIP